MLSSQSLKDEINERFAGFSRYYYFLASVPIFIDFGRWLDSNPFGCRSTKISQGVVREMKSLLTFVLTILPEKCSPTNRVRRFRLLFSRLSETVFAHIFSVFERKRKWAAQPRVRRFHLKIFSGSKRHGFLSHFRTKISGAPYPRTKLTSCSTTEKRPVMPFLMPTLQVRTLDLYPLYKGPLTWMHVYEPWGPYSVVQNWRKMETAVSKK